MILNLGFPLGVIWEGGLPPSLREALSRSAASLYFTACTAVVMVPQT